MSGRSRPARVSLVLAVADDGVIGRANDLPWRLPADLRRFKALTLGHPLIMGRRTFESIGRPLPGRRNLVLSRDPEYRPAGAEVHPSLPSALRAVATAEEVFVIGGAAVFAAALALADRLHVTRVHARVAGDVRFEGIDTARWQRVSAERHEPDADHAHAYTFEVWERAGGLSADPAAD